MKEEQTTEADIAAINKIWEQYAAGINIGDLDLWMALWADDGIQLPPGEPAHAGKEQIRTANKPLFDRLTAKIAINNKEVRVAGDWAFSRGLYTLDVTPKEGGETTHIDGKFLTILKRQSDGSWKIFRDCFNSNVPPE